MAVASLTRRMRVVFGTLDQVFSSMSNGLITFAIAVASTTQSFGQIVLMMTAFVAVIGAQRGAVGTPLLLKADQTSAQIRREGSFALVAGLTIGVAVCAVMLIFGWTVGLPAILLAVSAPIVLCQDVLRYVAIADARPYVAAVWDGIWALGTVLLLVSAWLKIATVPLLIGGWGCLALVALVGMSASLRVRPRLHGVGAWARAGWQHRVRYGIHAGLEQIIAFAVLAMVAVVLSSADTAALRGATVLLAPIAILASALQLIVISESTRDSSQPRTVWYGLVRLTAAISCLTLLVGGVLCVLPVSVGRYLLGQSFEPAQHVLPVVVVEYVATMLILALGVFLRTFNRSADLLRFNIGSAVVTLAASTCAAVVFDSAIGVAVGLAVGTILCGSVGLALFTPWESRARASSVDIAGGKFNE